MFIRKQHKIILLSTSTVISVLIITSPLLLSNLFFQNINVDLEFDRDDAYYYLKDQLDIGYRIPGTQAREDCANYFISEFQKIDSDFSYTVHNFTIHSTDCQNVLFKMNEEKSNIVILGAHYDSRAEATKEGSTDPVPGANDGASGCAVLLELADVLYNHKQDFDCQIWFLFFDAEDQGDDGSGEAMPGWVFIEGSEEFVDDIDTFYDSGIEDFDCMILLDMVGGDNLKFIKELNSNQLLLSELFSIGRALGYNQEFPINYAPEDITDDHVPFKDYGIPTADLIIKFWDTPTEWPYHHTTEDDISHISRHSLEVTGKTIEQFIYNNYYTKSNNYQGNFPWDSNQNVLNAILFIGILSAIIIGTIIALYLIRRNTLKQLREIDVSEQNPK